MSDVKIEVTGETCPVPLVEMRKALKGAQDGEVIKIIGDHPPSKEEIPMAVESMGSELVDVREEEGIWKIRIRK